MEVLVTTTEIFTEMQIRIWIWAREMSVVFVVKSMRWRMHLEKWDWIYLEWQKPWTPIFYCRFGYYTKKYVRFVWNFFLICNILHCNRKIKHDCKHLGKIRKYKKANRVLCVASIRITGVSEIPIGCVSHQHLYNVNVCCGIIHNKLIGPYFIYENLNEEKYRHFL